MDRVPPQKRWQSLPFALGVWPFPPWAGSGQEDPGCCAPRLAAALLCPAWVFTEGWGASGSRPGSAGVAGTSASSPIPLLSALSLKLKLNHHHPLESVHRPALTAFFEVLSLSLRICRYSSTSYHVSLELFVYISPTRPGTLRTVTFQPGMQKCPIWTNAELEDQPCWLMSLDEHEEDNV